MESSTDSAQISNLVSTDTKVLIRVKIKSNLDSQIRAVLSPPLRPIKMLLEFLTNFQKFSSMDTNKQIDKSENNCVTLCKGRLKLSEYFSLYCQ